MLLTVREDLTAPSVSLLLKDLHSGMDEWLGGEPYIRPILEIRLLFCETLEWKRRQCLDVQIKKKTSLSSRVVLLNQYLFSPEVAAIPKHPLSKSKCCLPTFY